MRSQIRSLAAGIAAVLAAGFASQPANAATPQPLVIQADVLFDGTQFLSGQAVLVENGIIAKVAPANQINVAGARVEKVPGGTILPGFIDMHTHHILNAVPPRRMLEHGVTTARDLGGPAKPVQINRPYQLRQFTSGLILSAVGGYPNVVFPGSGVEVKGTAQARAAVDKQIAGGASVIAVSLERGGEYGAPWHWHVPASTPPWPVLTDAELDAIVDQAHNVHHVRVVAYLGNDQGAQRALAAGIEEWAHMPCNRLTPGTIAAVGAAGVAIDGTIDTEVECRGVHENAADLVAAGAKLFYATDMGHPDIPHGIDAQEIHMGTHAGLDNGKPWVDSITQALASATSQAGDYLGLTPLVRIKKGAPADLIVIGSDPRANFKELEYPRLVVKDGLVVIKRAKGE
jgi:imidazolonepropionase-like amidohydrolase